MSDASRDETWNPGLAHRVGPASYLNPVNLVNRKAGSHKVKGPVEDNLLSVLDLVPARRLKILRTISGQISPEKAFFVDLSP
jgi:hypothetical protein